MDSQEAQRAIIQSALQAGVPQIQIRRYVQTGTELVQAISKQMRENGGYERGSVEQIEAVTPLALRYWTQSIEQGALRPESVPQGVVMLYEMRQRILDRMATGTPESPAYSPDRLLADLTSDTPPIPIPPE